MTNTVLLAALCLLKCLACGSGSTLGTVKSFKNMSQSTDSQTSENQRMLYNPDNIVWVDMEMTGLDHDTHHVLEVACLVTDGDLNILEEGPDICIYQPQDVLESMNDWSTKQHGESGLTKLCGTSDTSIKQAEVILLDFVSKWTRKNECPLAGNTVYMDRLFLKKHMPTFEKHMHYRIIDVSSVKELCRRWYPDIFYNQPNKKENCTHRAMADIKCSVEELKFYKENIFRKVEAGGAMGMSWY